MINKENYPKAYSETYEILNFLPKDEYEKIDKKFIMMLEKMRDLDYRFEYDSMKGIEEQDILRETKSVLAYIFLHYLATNEEVEIILKRLDKYNNDVV